jgi:hypothetical protein
MSPSPGADPQPTTAAPIACSLDAGGFQSQEQRWEALARRAGIDRAATADGVALTFRADDDVEHQLRELVAVENQCCAWARWEVHAVGDGDGDGDAELVMRARASGDGVGTLRSMFLRAA